MSQFDYKSPKRPTKRSFQDDYFRTLYGETPGQTVPDRARDWLIRKLVARHSEGGLLLDIGCGFGYLLEGFNSRWTLYGIDISEHAAEVAKNRLPHAHVLAADIQEGVPFSDRFDAAIAVNVMEHLPKPERAAQAIARAIKPGGIFVAHLPTINGTLSRWLYIHSGYESDPTHVYRPSGDEFIKLMKNAGFETLQVLYCPFWPQMFWQRIQPHPAFIAIFRRSTG